MKAEETGLPGVRLIRFDVFEDARGRFFETYDSERYRALGIETAFVHDSCSSSVSAGTVRGFHFQKPPHAQDKLVRVNRGRVFDVIVDIRHGAPTFGRHVALELDAGDATAVFVPAGFAHGFCSLSDHAEISYKMSDHFSPADYMGLLWSDPALGIDWPVSPEDAVVSEKDSRHPTLAQLPEVFRIP